MIGYNVAIADYQELVSKVVNRTLYLYKDFEKMATAHGAKAEPFEDAVNDLLDAAIRECITNYYDKWTIIQHACSDTDNLFYCGDFSSLHDTPYDAFVNGCLRSLEKKIRD